MGSFVFAVVVTLSLRQLNTTVLLKSSLVCDGTVQYSRSLLI
jgi:hypothetical protein